jgi:hypothetical protein
MKKRHGLFALSCAAMSVCLLFSGCVLTYTSESTEDGWEIGYSKIEKRCFIACYYWDGNTEDMTLEIPDEYLGYPVKELGGYIGRGYPMSFSIWFPESYQIERSCDISMAEAKYADTYTVTELVFTLKIGKNLTSLYYGGDQENEYAMTEEDENGNRIAYHVTYEYICSEENKTFYSEGGKLYYIANNEEASWGV